MSFRYPAAPASAPRMPRRPRLLLPIVVLLLVALIALSVFTGLFTDLLWFKSVSTATPFSRVFTTRLWTQVLLFLVFGLLMAATVAANLVMAYRLRPPFRPLSPEQQNLERYRVAIEPHLVLFTLAIAAGFGVLAGSSAAGRWETWLLWRNGQSFGTKDAQFGRDVSYYAFTYPFYRFVLGFLFAAVVLGLIAALVTHYLFGGLRLQTPGDKVSPGAQAHLAVLLGIFLLLKAVAYWLDRYGLAFSDRGRVTGPSYTDVNAVLPAKTILVFVAIICAGLFFAAVFSRGWLLPAVGLGLMVVAAVLIGGVYPAVVQQFQVKPSEADKEAKYIGRNITATNKAYGLDKVTVKRYDGTATATSSEVQQDAGTLNNVRLLDPNLLQATFNRQQSLRGFYSFPDTLDIDRYPINGQQQDQIVAVRELDQSGLSAGQRNWINEHLVYTHGIGFVAAPGNQVDAQGRPVFDSSNVPVNASGALKQTQPRVYFGEQSPSYAIVGAPAGTPARELDYPSDQAAGGQANTTYKGQGGVEIGSPLRRALYALHFRQKNLLLSSGVNSASKLLYIREPRERVQKVAPWLTMDGDPYPAVIGGRIKWILDGYTTSDGYPYSERQTLGDLTTDSTVVSSNTIAAQARAQVNYIRNSVKVTVDAYDGTVDLYQWDTKDAVLKTWMKAFPGIVHKQSDIPTELQAHLRYPEDLFKVQRDLLGRYHVKNPRDFYSGNDYWRVPDDPTSKNTADQPPYYLTLTMPGETRPQFSLTSTLVANNRPNLTAFVQVASDPGDNYGRITVLQLPRDTTVNGPGQVTNAFESKPAVAEQLSLLRRAGSDVVLGNLLTLPVGGGLLYVEPVYVRATGTTASFPSLQKVLLAYGDQISFTNTLAEGLSTIFGTPSGTTTPPPSTGPTPPPTKGNTALQQAISEASAAFAQGQAALKRGDFTAYGAAQKRLQTALAAAAAASRTKPSASATPTAGASAPPGTGASATPTTGASAAPSGAASPLAAGGPSPTPPARGTASPSP